MGADVYFQTGTYEHGKKIETAARNQGLDTKAFVDQRAAEFRAVFQALGVKYDRFFRTTDSDHARVVQYVLQRVFDRGDIYPGFYQGFYCLDCEAYFADEELQEGCCPIHLRPVEMLKEQCYFFRLSKYQDALLKHYQENPGFILPPSRLREIRNFVSSGLKDFSISRSTFKWGIPLPFDKSHVTYVWFDALINYITGAGYLEQPDKFLRRWRGSVHIVGKDIVRFHTVHWPAMLMAAEIELPRRIHAHGFWMVNGRKFSKSLGNSIQPQHLIERYGLDPLRYYLLRVPPFGEDGNFSEAELVQRNNSELAHGLGNLVSRTTTMIQRYRAGIVPSTDIHSEAEIVIARKADATVATFSAAMADMAFSNALGAIEAFVADLNRYVNERAPWKLAETGATVELDAVLGTTAEAIRFLSVLVTPFMPESASKIRKCWGDEEVQSASELVWGNRLAGKMVRQLPPLFKTLEQPAAEIPPPVVHSADKAVLEMGISYCVAQLSGLRVRKKASAVEQRKREVEARIKTLGRSWAQTVLEVRGYQELYARIGKKIGDVPSPVESLSQYIFDSELGRLPQKNVVVDLYNLYSLTHFLSIGAHDRTKVKGAIRLEFARSPISYRPLGLPGTMQVLPGEYYWHDDQNVLCRLDLKQGEVTKIDDSTRHIVLIVLGNRAILPTTVRQQTEALCNEIVGICGGEYAIIDGAGTV